MAASLMCVATIYNLAFPWLFAQPGLVALNHQEYVTIMFRNCSVQDVTMPLNTTLGYLENLKIDCFNNISLIHQEKAKKDFNMMLHSQNHCQIV